MGAAKVASRTVSPLPRVLVQQKDGDFLCKKQHDKNLIEPIGGEVRAQDEQVVLTLNPSGRTYVQSPGSKRPIVDMMLIRSPENSDRFLAPDKLATEQPDALVMARDIFVQNGFTRYRKSFRSNEYPNGNFSDILWRGQFKNDLFLCQTDRFDEIKRCTAASMSRPDFPWPADIPVPVRKDLALQSSFDAREMISNPVFNAVPLRLTYQPPTQERRREPSLSPSEGSDMPFEVLHGIEELSPVNKSGTRCLKRPAENALDSGREQTEVAKSDDETSPAKRARRNRGRASSVGR